MKITILSRLALVAAVGFLASCKSSTTDPGTGTNAGTVVKPSIGSTYNWKSTETDSMGMEVSSSTSIHTVISNNASVEGKSAYLIQTMSENGTMDTTAIRYETNGDISAFGGTSWVIYPFASKAAQTMTVDMPGSETGLPYDFHIVSTMTGTSTAPITINGKSFTAEKVHAAIQTTIIAGGQTVGSAPSSEDYWFVPQLGYLAKIQNPGGSINGEWQNGETQILTSYSLK